ncbi:MAG: hypothetical protein ACOYEO_08345 [bacterium]|jgi:hypothetical protein
MLFLRLGPQYLYLRSQSPNKVESALVKLDAVRGLNLTTTTSNAGENQSVVVLDNTVFLVPHPAAVILAYFINSGTTPALENAELGPGFLLMRIPTSGSPLINRLAEEYQGQKVDLTTGLDSGYSEHTLLGFTTHPLSTTINNTQMEPDYLLIPRPANSLFQDLRQAAVRHFTKALKDDNGEWYELRINIYDAWGNYKLHLERLILVLEELETGLILGERWTRDHAFALMSVTAYQVRLFTHWHPLAVKELLLGLEYNAAGQRIVDLDLYYKNQKVNWVQAAKGKGRRKRDIMGKTARDQLLGKLPPWASEQLIVQEQAAPV